MPPDDGSSLFNSAHNRRENSPSIRPVETEIPDDEQAKQKSLGVVEYAPIPS
jgi:hypothetical protein